MDTHFISKLILLEISILNQSASHHTLYGQVAAKAWDAAGWYLDILGPSFALTFPHHPHALLGVDTI